METTLSTGLLKELVHFLQMPIIVILFTITAGCLVWRSLLSRAGPIGSRQGSKASLGLITSAQIYTSITSTVLLATLGNLKMVNLFMTVFVSCYVISACTLLKPNKSPAIPFAMVLRLPLILALNWGLAHATLLLVSSKKQFYFQRACIVHTIFRKIHQKWDMILPAKLVVYTTLIILVNFATLTPKIFLTHYLTVYLAFQLKQSISKAMEASNNFFELKLEHGGVIADCITDALTTAPIFYYIYGD